LDYFSKHRKVDQNNAQLNFFPIKR